MPKIPAPAHSPLGWLPNLISRLGPPQKDPELARWTWQDQEIGVLVDKLTHAWQTVAWTPARSVTVRSLVRPSDADMLAVVKLAGLHDQLRTTP